MILIRYSNANMTTLKELRQHAKDIGLRGISRKCEAELIQLIAEVRAEEFLERVKRSLQTGRYPALQGDPEDPHKRTQRRRELRQLEGHPSLSTPPPTALLSSSPRTKEKEG